MLAVEKCPSVSSISKTFGLRLTANSTGLQTRPLPADWNPFTKCPSLRTKTRHWTG